MLARFKDNIAHVQQIVTIISQHVKQKDKLVNKPCHCPKSLKKSPANEGQAAALSSELNSELDVGGWLDFMS